MHAIDTMWRCVCVYENLIDSPVRPAPVHLSLFTQNLFRPNPDTPGYVQSECAYVMWSGVTGPSVSFSLSCLCV